MRPECRPAEERSRQITDAPLVHCADKLVSDWSSTDKTSSAGEARRVSACGENQYPHERAVADGVNVGYDVYRIRTQVTEQGGQIDKGLFVDPPRKKDPPAPVGGGFDDDLTFIREKAGIVAPSS